MYSALFLTHLFATFFLNGVIWLIQLVHYPMLKAIDEREFKRWHDFHCRWITPVVGPLMFTELLTSMCFFPPFGFRIPLQMLPEWFAWSAFPMVVGIWLSTCMIQSPMHSRLSSLRSKAGIDELVRWNWVRTILWTLRSGCCLAAASFAG